MPELEKNIQEQSAFANALLKMNVQGAVIEHARWIILDSIGCILCGLNGHSPGRSTDERIMDLSAAMVSTELYEGNRKAVGHPACHLLPLLLSEAAGRGIPWGEFLRIFVAGYEIAARWGAAVQFPTHILGHGTVMAAGAAVMLCMLAGQPEEEMYETILLANSLPSVSVWQSVYDGSQLHDIYPGLAAITARNSQSMRRLGAKSTSTILRDVLEKVMGATLHPGALTMGLGHEYWINSNYFKVHTGCRFIHPFADVLAEELESGLEKGQVEEIRVFTYEKAAQLTAQCVPNDLAGKFSIPVSLAVLLEKGALTPATIRSCETEQAVRDRARHIWLYEDESYNRLLPDVRGGRLEILKSDGTVQVREVFHAAGDFDHPVPFTREKLEKKFRSNAAACLSAEEQQTLMNAVLQGDEWDTDVEQVLSVFYQKTGETI